MYRLLPRKASLVVIWRSAQSFRASSTVDNRPYVRPLHPQRAQVNALHPTRHRPVARSLSERSCIFCAVILEPSPVMLSGSGTAEIK